MRLTPVIVSSRLTAGSSLPVCNLRVENPQILAQPIELAQVPLDGGALVIGHELLRQPDPAQPSEQVGMRARRDQMGVQDRVHLVLDPRAVPDDGVPPIGAGARYPNPATRLPAGNWLPAVMPA